MPQAKKKLSQEALSELSLENKCYVSVATLKRAELGKPVSRKTLDKLARLFGVESRKLTSAELSNDINKQLIFDPMLDPVVIHWDKLEKLNNINEHIHINYLCIELHDLLLKLKNDEIICQVFSRR